MHRRSLLKLGLLSAALLAAVGVPLATLRPGLEGARLSAPAREVIDAVARAILEGTLPAAPAAQRQALSALLDRVDTLVAGLPPHAQAELSQLLSVLASSGGRRALAGLPEPWPQASVAQVQAALGGMRVSTFGLKQQAYQALHDIVGGAYFSEPATWSAMGYPGPLAI